MPPEGATGVEKMGVGRALATSGFPMLGVWLGGLLARGFSWGDLGALLAIWAFLFLLLMAFFGRRRRTRREGRRG